jgi:hypothetical protein
VVDLQEPTPSPDQVVSLKASIDTKRLVSSKLDQVDVAKLKAIEIARQKVAFR